MSSSSLSTATHTSIDYVRPAELSLPYPPLLPRLLRLCWLRWLIVILIVVSWHTMTSSSIKALSTFFAGSFNMIEYIWYGLSIENPDGSVAFAPFSKNRRQPFTTAEQFFVNLFTTPLIHLYMMALPHPVLRVGFFPVVLWTVEVIQHYFLKFLFGRNTAWLYYGATVYFEGAIRLSMWPLWLILGAALQGAYFGLPISNL